MRGTFWLLGGTLLTVLGACNSSDKNASNPCAALPEQVGGCGTDCSASATVCAIGYYCNSNGVCNADCNTSAGINCADGLSCSANGQCIPTSTNNSDGGDNICASVDVDTTPGVPNIWLVIDASGSMIEDFEPNVSRWDALRDLLIGEQGSQPGGLVNSKQDVVRFGLAMYSSRSINNSHDAEPGTLCPMINSDNAEAPNPLEPVLDNYNAINALYGDANTIDDTPTGDSIAYLADYVAANPPEAGPTWFILATDGEPDTCADHNPSWANQPAANTYTVEKVQAAFDQGIRTIMLAVSDSLPEAHMQQMANAGAGEDINTGTTPYYTPTTAAELSEQLGMLVQDARPCEFELNGEIQDMDQACTGTVTLTVDGQSSELECNGSNGWEATDSTHIALKGSACTDFQASSTATLSGNFPCDVVFVF